MKILKYKKLKDNKYEIELDNGISLKLYDDVIVKYNLLIKKNITDIELEDINKYNDSLVSYYKALKYITKKLRSEKEIRNYLGKEFDQKVVDDVIDKLNKQGYLDKNVYIKSYVIDHFNLSNDGPYKIKNDLVNLDFLEYDVLLELDNIDDEEWLDKLKKIITKRIKVNHQYGNNKLKEKLLYEMGNLGYPKWMIEEVYTRVDFSSDNNLLIKEFDKWYLKLSKKYSDNMLYYQLKNKLLSKGFKSSEIEDLWQQKKN